MIHTLLSNRMEDLVNPLATLLAVPVENPLAPDISMPPDALTHSSGDMENAAG